MDNSLWFATVTCSFLFTYLIHSTVIVGAIALLVNRSERFRLPALQVLAWKLAIFLPLLTTTSVTFFPYPHWGFQFALSESQNSDVVVQNDLPSFEVYDSSEFNPLLATADDANDYRHDMGQSPISSDAAVAIWSRVFSLFTWPKISQSIVALWTMAVLVGLIKLCVQAHRLRHLRNNSVSLSHTAVLNSLHRLIAKMDVVRRVELLESAEITGAFTAGIWRPFIVVPASHNENFSDVMISPESEALLAHELAHIAHRDAAWNLLVQVIQKFFPVQPLNRISSRQLQIAMDFAADDSAAKVLGGQFGLVQCLIQVGDRMFDRHTTVWTRSGLVAGMVAFRSTLGQRIERLLEKNSSNRETSSASKLKALACLTAFSMTGAALVPQAVAEKKVNVSENLFSSSRGNTMKSKFSTLAVLIGLTSPVAAEEPQETDQVQQREELKATPDKLPEGIQRFNGMLVGRLAAKDVEKGSFVVVVDAVPRVWKNSEAENPKSIVGKSIQVEGVFGRFLDVLVTTRIGETVEFECKHDGDALLFPGELLRKVAPFQAEDYPVLPEEFRGFRGTLAAEIKKKDPETFELIVEVKQILNVSKESEAKKPETIVGKQMMLAGFWNRKEAYHDLKEGDRIEIGVQHIGRQSDHLTVAEFIRQGSEVSMERMRQEERPRDGSFKGIQGFRGMLVGRLVKKDVERGTFTVTVDAVPRVWNNNQSTNPKSLVGKDVDAEGVPAQLLDALVVTRIGETIQFGALHDGGDSLRVGEVLRIVAPVEKGDYPELPDEFRGFSGVLQANVVKKDEQLWELTVEVTDVVKAFEKDQSQNAEAVVGKQVMLSGFWNKKEAYHSISVGDKVEVGVEHPQKLGDQLSVMEGVRKLNE